MQHLTARLKAAVKQRMLQFLARKQPPSMPVTIHHRFMFVLPTRFGVAMLLLVLLLYVLGTNYQNNLILLLAYAMLVWWVSTILLVYLNLHGLSLCAEKDYDCFSGQTLLVRLRLKPQQDLPVAMQVQWQLDTTSAFTVVQNDEVVLPLACPTRGLHLLPRIYLQSRHPFGLMRCWGYLQLQSQLWVYPKPQLYPTNHTAASASEQLEDWIGLRDWQVGDPMRQIDWKRFSKDAKLRVHQYGDSPIEQSPRYLMLNPAIADKELQLRDLTARVLQRAQHEEPFGVVLHQQQFAPATGQAHVTTILRALALC